MCTTTLYIKPYSIDIMGQFGKKIKQVHNIDMLILVRGSGGSHKVCIKNVQPFDFSLWSGTQSLRNTVCVCRTSLHYNTLVLQR